MKYKYSASLLGIAAAAALGLSACKPQLTPDVNYNSGSIDVSRYVAVGNSLTAGYADGTLYRSGQQSAYPAILSSIFAAFGGSAYNAPLLPGESGWPGPKRVLGLSTDCSGTTSLGPVIYSGDRGDTAGSSANVSAMGPYNNLGVPGIRTIDFLNPFYGGLNPYAKRLYTSSNPLGELSRIQPTFFTLWIGNNDVLAYATSGGAGKSSNGSPFNPADANSISSNVLFANALDSILNRLMPAGSTAKGAIINIPDVTAIPYFTTIPYNGLTLSRQSQVDSLNFAYQPAGISFTLGANPFIIQDASVPGLGFRKATSADYILLTTPQDSIKCGGWGSKKPLPASYVLDAKEVAAVRAATKQFNDILYLYGTRRGLAYVDMNTYLKSIVSGISFNGSTVNATFVRGGAFSLDGIHLTPRGNALVANEILRRINEVYVPSMPMVDANSYSGVMFP